MKFGFDTEFSDLLSNVLIEGETDGRAAKTATVWLLEPQTEMMACSTPDTSAPNLGKLRNTFNPRRLNSKGEIKNSGDCVWYRVPNLANDRRHQIEYSDRWVQTNAPGQTYTSVLSQITSPQIKVYKDDGMPLVQDGSAVEDQVLEADRRFRAPLIRFTPATTGYYYVRVSSLGYDVGEFTISYTDIGPGTAPATAAEPLTAAFSNMPQSHDGSTAFIFRIAFSADVDITPQNMRDHALTVTGGTVTNATGVGGRSDLWELTVEPAGTAAVTILVPLNRTCTETGALCTADGLALSTAPGHSVPGPALVPQAQAAATPLTASFVSVPAEHDGETAFWLELSFDAAVVQGSKPHIEALLGVSGGSVTKFRRKDEQRAQWRIRISPASHEAVTVTLSPSPACGETGAVCTDDGRTFTTAIAQTIPGPVTPRHLIGTDDDDTLSGQDGNDTLEGGLGDDTLDGGAGDDTLYGDDGDPDVTDPAEGDDVLDGEGGDDVLYGDAGDDTLYGGADNDELYGDADDDELYGESGDDDLYGGGGDDVLDGGGGADILTGGLGADTFVFAAGHGTDTITDFTPAEADLIDLRALSGITGFAALTLTAEDTDTLLDLSAHGGGTVLLEDIAVADLAAEDFLLP